MRVIEYLPGRTLSGGCVVALGFFDGVHAAHRALIGEARRTADEMGLPLVVFTFPAESKIKGNSARIYDTGTKIELLGSLSVDVVLLADFAAVAGLTPEEFVRDVLIRDLDARVAVCGFNYRFGKGASGDAKMLENLMNRGGRVAKIHDELTKDGRTVSATDIRAALADGDVVRARELLTVPYFLRGRVGHGMANGRRIGFPTVNIPVGDGRVNLRRGVYKTAVPIGEKLYTGLTNLGNCPTFGARETHAETYILDFAGDLYDREVTVYFLEFIRDEIEFSSAEALAEQIKKDIDTALKGRTVTWQEIGLN